MEPLKDVIKAFEISNEHEFTKTYESNNCLAKVCVWPEILLSLAKSLCLNLNFARRIGRFFLCFLRAFFRH